MNSEPEIIPEGLIKGLELFTGFPNLSGLTSNQGLSASYVLTMKLSDQVFNSHNWISNLGLLNRGVNNTHGSKLLEEENQTNSNIKERLPVRKICKT